MKAARSIARGATVGGLGLLVLVAGLSAPAAADAELEYSEPAECQVVFPVQQIVLGFNQEVDPAGSGFSVVDETGRTVAVGGVDLDDLDRDTLISVLSGPLPLGVYNIEYVAVSVFDGDAFEGQIPFIVDNPSVDNASPEACSAGIGSSQGGSVADPIVVAGSVVLLAGFGAAVVRSKVSKVTA